jgi:integrase
MIRQHPARGLWEARYVGADGRKHSLYAKTRAAAQERLRAALTAADNGVAPADNRTTVAAYLETWLDTTVAVRVRPRTADSYRDTVRRYIVPSIGRVSLAKLTPEHVAGMVKSLQARGDLSPTTVRYALTVLRIALGRAAKTGRVVRNVAALVDAPAKADHQLRPLSVEQVAAFLDAVDGDRLRAMYVAAIGLGLRQGELLALRWSDIDLDAGTITVRHTLNPVTMTLAEPKTERARRTLRIPSEVHEALREHRHSQVEERLAAGSRWADLDYVFATRRGRPLMARNVLRALHEQLQRAGLPRQRFHDLRHAYATLLLEDGEELGVISRTLGHANITTTANIYAHLTPAMLERTAARMDGILTRHKRASGA